MPTLSEVDPGSVTSAALSGTGRYAFYVAKRTTSGAGLYVTDRQTGTSTRIALHQSANGVMELAPHSVSTDGRYVAFMSSADPATGAANAGGARYAYVYDRVANATRLVSRRQPSEGSTPFWAASAPSLSADGRYVLVAAWPDDVTSDPSLATTSISPVRIDLTGSADTVAPPKPPRIGVSADTSTGLTLNWGAVTDNGGGPIAYRVRLRSINGKTAGILGEQLVTGTRTRSAPSRPARPTGSRSRPRMPTATARRRSPAPSRPLAPSTPRRRASPAPRAPPT